MVVTQCAKIITSMSKLFRAVPVLLAFAGLIVAVPSASASKTHLPVENLGSGREPVFGSVNSIAVEASSGDLIVLSQKKHALQISSRRYARRFPISREQCNRRKRVRSVPDHSCDCDQTPEGGLSFSDFAGLQQVAIDNSGTVSDGDIYVTQSVSNNVDIFNSSGEYIGQLNAAYSADQPNRFPRVEWRSTRPASFSSPVHPKVKYISTYLRRTHRLTVTTRRALRRWKNHAASPQALTRYLSIGLLDFKAIAFSSSTR